MDTAGRWRRGHKALSTLPCTRVQRQNNARLHRRDARPSSSLPVVALMTSMAESPTVQLTLKLGAFPGCRASALLMPEEQTQEEVSEPGLWSMESTVHSGRRRHGPRPGLSHMLSANGRQPGTRSNLTAEALLTQGMAQGNLHTKMGFKG